MTERPFHAIALDAASASRQELAPASTVGAKAHNLMRMAALELPVPPGFVLGTDVCRETLERGELPPGVEANVAHALRDLERATQLELGSERRPLLVSVRSGAAVSMPGMLETVLNVGLSERSVRGLIRLTGSPHLAWDSYRRLIQCYAEVVHAAPAEPFEALVTRALEADDLDTPDELDAVALEQLCESSLETFRALAGVPFPQDPRQQLLAALEAVFRSWVGPRAREYRRLHELDDSAGTAAVVQVMVFGNSGGRSGSGVGFTRDPATGADELYVDFLFNAQGEDVVSGRHASDDRERLRRALPAVESDLQRIKQVLEGEFRDLQDFEFTVERGRLYLLQTRSGKRTPWAALHVAVDLVRAGKIAPEEALARLADYDLDKLVRRRLDAATEQTELARAVPASTGVAVGAIALDSARARAAAEAGESAILVRRTTSTDDIAGIAAATGLLTSTGSRTSHASVVARQLGKVCLVGCRELSIDDQARSCRLGERELREGELISLDGDSGRVFAGRLQVSEERPEAALAEIARWRRA